MNVAYARIGSSFRPAVFAVGVFNIAQSACEQAFQRFGKEIYIAYEVGFKVNLFNGRMRLNVIGC